ncbi:MAG TPA: helix-turn-helix domain-containing protein [Solirubrobacter sp.]|nr:helix-turn-helix domain-containing protein [Solirubrobacter sp.]
MYREIAPPPDLAGHVACVWTSVSRGGVIFPDGCVDIVWRGDSLVVAGPATAPVSAGVPVGVPVFGVRFRVGAAGAALGLPAEELLDESAVPLGELWGFQCEERVAEGGLAALLDVVRSHVVDAPLDRVARAAALSVAQPGARVADLGPALGLSERQLRRRFADAVGYGPKTLARVLRFQRFLALATRSGAGRWRSGDGLAGLAYEAGYADQAHLTRECRRLSGRTPAELVASGATAAGERLL